MTARIEKTTIVYYDQNRGWLVQRKNIHYESLIYYGLLVKKLERPFRNRAQSPSRYHSSKRSLSSTMKKVCSIAKIKQ